MPKHPIQPLVRDENDVVRFKKNNIVSFILDANPKVDMNLLERIDFPVEDREQFAQLIGYSLRGFAELSYVTNRTYNKARSQKVYKKTNIRSLYKKV